MDSKFYELTNKLKEAEEIKAWASGFFLGFNMPDAMNKNAFMNIVYIMNDRRRESSDKTSVLTAVNEVLNKHLNVIMQEAEQLLESKVIQARKDLEPYLQQAIVEIWDAKKQQEK